jgi:hypothetical protein
MSEDTIPVVPPVVEPVVAVVPPVVEPVAVPKVEAKPEGWAAMTDAEKLAAVNSERDAKLAANNEAKTRRFRVAELEAKLATYEAADNATAEANLAATELVKKRDADIVALKLKYTALEQSIIRDKVVSKVTEALLAKTYSPKLIKIALAAAPGLNEDNADDFIKEFAKEWKDTLVPPKPEPVKSVNPWAAAQPPADVAPEGTPGRTPAEKQFNQIFPKK